MDEFAKPLGSTQLDRALTQDFVVVTADTTVRQAGELVRARAPRAKFFFSYLVLARDGGAWAIIRWPELEQLVAAHGTAAKELPLRVVLAAWPTVAAITRGMVSFQRAGELLDQQPGRRLLVLDHNQPVGVFAKELRGAVPTVPAPAQQPVARQINVWIDDGKGHGQRPLALKRRYILHLDVGAPRRESLVQGASIGSLRPYADSPTQATIAMTFIVVADATQIELLGPTEYTIMVPVDAGASAYEALFQLRPLVTGDVSLLVYVLVNDQVLQTLEVQLAVAVAEHTITPGVVGAQRVVVQGYTLDSIAHLRARNNPLSLIIAPKAGGYELLLVGQAITRASISLQPHDLAELVHEARAALTEVVYSQDANGDQPYLSGWQIPLPVHTKALQQLARVGRRLFDTLFFSDGNESSAAAMGRRIRELGQLGPLNIEIVGQHFVFPWALIYDRPKSEPLTTEGFWGCKHVIQQLPEAGSPKLIAFRPIDASRGVKLAFVFNASIGTVAAQRHFLSANLPSVRVRESSSEAELVALLDSPDNDAHIIYLYCHAESVQPGASHSAHNPRLVGDSRLVLTHGTPGISLRQLEDDTDREVELPGAPLVFLNACQGAALSPFMYQGLVPFFIRKGARGVLGTEVDTPARFAAEFAQRLLQRFVAGNVLLGHLLLELRQEFVTEHHNVMPLVYSLYGSGDTQIVPP